MKQSQRQTLCTLITLLKTLKVPCSSVCDASRQGGGHEVARQLAPRFEYICAAMGDFPRLRGGSGNVNGSGNQGLMPVWEGVDGEGKDVPFIGRLGGFEILDAVYAEGDGNHVFRRKLSDIKGSFGGYRRVKGDGNCFIRQAPL